MHTAGGRVHDARKLGVVSHRQALAMPRGRTRYVNVLSAFQRYHSWNHPFVGPARLIPCVRRECNSVCARGLLLKSYLPYLYTLCGEPIIEKMDHSYCGRSGARQETSGPSMGRLITAAVPRQGQRPGPHVRQPWPSARPSMRCAGLDTHPRDAHAKEWAPEPRAVTSAGADCRAQSDSKVAAVRVSGLEIAGYA